MNESFGNKKEKSVLNSFCMYRIYAYDDDNAYGNDAQITF